MKQRSVDLWYSLPITRKQLALVRTRGRARARLSRPSRSPIGRASSTVAMRCNELASLRPRLSLSVYPLSARLSRLLLLLGSGALRGQRLPLHAREFGVRRHRLRRSAGRCALPLCVVRASMQRLGRGLLLAGRFGADRRGSPSAGSASPVSSPTARSPWTGAVLCNELITVEGLGADKILFSDVEFRGPGARCLGVCASRSRC